MRVPYQIPETAFNLEAEQIVLAAFMARPEIFNDLGGRCSPEVFYDPLHRQIFETMESLYRQGRPSNLVTLREYFIKNREEDAVDYLAGLSRSYIPLFDIKAYIEDLHRLHQRRQVYMECQEVMARIEDPDAEEDNIRLFEPLSDIFFESSGGQKEFERDYPKALKTFQEAIDKGLEDKKAGTLSIVITGLDSLDNILNGLQEGELHILGGRPGMGKSIVAQTIARNVANEGKVVVFFSLEMSAHNMMCREAASETDVFQSKLRRLELNPLDRSQIKGMEIGNKARWHIVDQAALSLTDMRRFLTSIQRRYGKIDLIVLDYLQLMETGNNRNQTRNDQIAALSRGLKIIAMDFKAPLLALSQLNRGVEGREDKRPSLADLRDSGAIEQDANSVMFAYREYYYLKDRKPTDPTKIDGWEIRLGETRNQIEIAVAKSRDGQIGTAHLAFWGDKFKVTNKATGEVVGFKERDGA